MGWKGQGGCWEDALNVGRDELESAMQPSQGPLSWTEQASKHSLPRNACRVISSGSLGCLKAR